MSLSILSQSPRLSYLCFSDLDWESCEVVVSCPVCCREEEEAGVEEAGVEEEAGGEA
jgi:hypothetical protein